MADSDVSTDCSSPKRYTDEETDQQILKWAGKLELESMDLRDKSSKLLQALQVNSEHLKDSCEKISIATCGLKNGKEVQEQLQDAKEHWKCLEKGQNESATNLGKFEKRLEDKIAKFVSSHSTDFAKAVTDVQSALVILSRQSETLSKVMLSMSSDTQRVSERQLQLEQQVRGLKTNLVTWREETARIKSRDIGYKNCCKITKPVSPVSSREQMRRKRTQTSAATRWIIPWEEISDSETLLSSEL
ncbi:LANO_0E16127g1_1 [Lachancea nothofagi CBS 11611]|uniref:LANO_0E16127g1_1 n=1 Tax=Lachancea nothofagi CBS 11611 TaxID=1266666 RepID=A0A1G4K1W4_9SACH|nr:LANO_0E16127g1_1 [Lachancea nothofagi CBS 11611]